MAKPLEEYMISDPICIYYVDGAFSYNSYLISTNEKLGQFSKEDLIAIDWTGIDIRKESMGYRKENSIQLKFFHAIENDYDVVINDDGSGEAADIVAFKVINDEILLTLIHCKFSSEDQPGARLKDLYEVCGQAQRSIRWKIMTFNYLYKHIKKREEKLKRDKGYTKFLKGNINDFSSIKNQARTKPIKLQVMIVQPGLSVSKVTDEMLKLLGSTSIFINKTTMADLIVFGSE